jgi:hypothetical protein
MRVEVLGGLERRRGRRCRLSAPWQTPGHVCCSSMIEILWPLGVNHAAVLNVERSRPVFAFDVADVRGPVVGLPPVGQTHYPPSAADERRNAYQAFFTIN